jgi:GAF domain-containing protein/CheY-like chemotaxis protein
VLVPDVEADTEHDIAMDHVHREGMRALLILPLVTGDEVVGAISLARSQPTRFSEEDIALLTLFAHQAAVALRNAGLFEDLARSHAQVAKYKEQLQELYRLGVAMQSAISLRERLDLILQGVHGVLGLDRIAIFLCDRDEQVLECRAALGEMEEPVEQIKLPLGPGGGILARVFREGQELLWSDEREVPADLRLGPPYSDFRTLRSRSFIILPLVSRGGTIGLLVADNKLSRGPFSDETLSLLRTFAAQAAIAIENAGLFDRQREAAAGAERQRAQAEALAAVGQAISASLDLDEVLSLLVERTAAATGAYAVAVLERETPTGALRFRKAHGLSHRYLEGLIFSSPAGVSVTALSGGRAQCTADVLADPSFTYPPETRARMAAEGIRGLLSVPIRGGDGPYGVLNLYWQDPHPCTEEEITFAARIADQAAIAIENARLFQREQERRRQVEAVRAVSEEITRELDLATVLNLINLRATDLLRAAAGTVWLWNEADQALAPRAWQGYGEWLGDQRRRLGEAVVGAVALRREGLILNEFRAWPHASRAILERSPVAKVAAEPLLYRERLIGVIIVDRLEGEASFTEEDRKLLALFAAQAAVAIENARLFQQEQERRRQVEAVRAVTEEITRELDLPALLGLIHRRAMELVGASSGCIHLWDEAAQVLVPKAWHGLGDWMQEVRFRLGEGISGVVAQRREGLIVNDYRGWPQASPLFLERTGVTATLAEPLLYRDKLIGVITVDSREADRTFTEKDRELLGLFAAQAAIAIENARLYQEVRDRARDLGILIRSGQTVTASLALPHILQTIADAAVAMTGAPEANLVLADEGGGLGWQASAGPLRQAFAQEREARPMPPGRGFAAQVVARGESLWVPDLAADPEDFYRDFNARHGLRCYLGVPIRARERVLGVLNITGPADGSVSQRQGELLESLAAQAAIAIENARLFQQELERRRQLEAVRAVTEEITRELNLSSLLTLIQRRATELVGAASGAIFLWDEDAQALVPKAWHGLGDFMQDVRLGPGESITGLVAQRRQGMIVNDYRVWPSASPIWLEHTGMTAVVAEPLLYRDRLLGVITINNEGTGQRFTEQDRQTLALFAAQAAIAIENARLYAQTREALDELEAIHEAGRAIAQSLDLQETLRHILAAAMRLTDTDKGIVTLLDEERQELVGIAFAGVTGHSEVRVPLSEHSFAVACFRAGHVLTTDHPETDPRCSPALQARFGNKALIAVPLLSGDRVIGVFDVGDLKRQRQFTPRQIAILERLAQHAVVAIENARLYAETRKAYEDLRAAQEQLVRVEKLKALGELSAGVAHDFNNLLAAILGRAQLLRMRSTDPQLRQGLEVIERAALDGAETVRRILGFARAGSEAEYAPVDLAALIPQVLEVTRPRWKDEAQQRGAAIEAELVLEPAPAVRGNAAELREVLVNLVFNAVDAMPHGGRLTVGTRRLWRPGPAGDAVNPHLEVLADQRDEVRELVEIFVRDTGVGMSESVRRRAFDPFFTSKGVKGSGLGLSVVYGIVSRHGGEVILESQEGAGTTVAIRLPATTRTPAEAGEPALSPAPRAGRIVVLDDEEVLAQTLADVLRLQRHQVEVFTEPRAALAHLAGASADLFFTDLGMPEMSGWDVAQEARRIHPQLPIVLVTGWGHQIDPAQVRECRVNALVSKPYRVQDIMRVVAEILPARPAP